MKKEQVDLLMVARGLAESREHAAKLVMAGLVVAGEHRVDKPGTKIPLDMPLRLKERLPYVSRGGLKLAKAVTEFSLSFQNAVVMDIGASTGGFTDVSLKNGASKVFAVDVGFNQLHNALIHHPQVVSLEQTNFCTMPFETVGQAVDIIVTDVSFISLTRIIPPAVTFCREGTLFVPLIKPQFEARKEEVGENGIVRDTSVHKDVLSRIIPFATEHGFCLKGLTASPITGAKGNIEYLACFVYNKRCNDIDVDAAIRTVIDENSSYHC